MRVLLCQRKLMHYRLPLFRRLNGALNGGLVVAHGQAPNQSVSIGEDVGFVRLYAENHWLRGEDLDYQNLVSAAKSTAPDVIVAEHAVRNIGTYQLLLWARRAGIPLLLWGHGRSQKRPLSDRGLQNALYRWMIDRAAGFVAYTRSRADEVRELFPGKPVFQATNTLDTSVLFEIRTKLEREGKASVKSRYGLTKEKYLLFIGRLHSDKLPRLVLSLADSLVEKGLDVGVLFIGEGPELEELRQTPTKCTDVRFLGEIEDWEKSAPYIYASDILVMPQWVGLAANHGIALGTPILTFTPAPGALSHPPEIDYVRNGVTGYEVDYGDWSAFVERAEYLLEHADTFRQQCIAFAESEISIERWLNEMMGAINAVSHHGTDGA